MKLGNAPFAGSLALFRLRLLPSALCDVVAGLALAGGLGEIEAPLLLRVLGTSGCLYSAGMVMNDVADAAEDQRLGRPRPIPRQLISRGAAAALGALLLAAALAIAPPHLAPLAASIAALVLTYDFVLKPRVVPAALCLAMCRGLNLALGFYVLHGLHLPPRVLLGPALAYGAYVALTVVHGSLEDRKPDPARSQLVLVAAALCPFPATAFLPYPAFAIAAALPTLALVLRAPAIEDGGIPARTGILLRGLPRFTCALAAGTAAWAATIVLAAVAYLLPWLLRPRPWT